MISALILFKNRLIALIRMKQKNKINKEKIINLTLVSDASEYDRMFRETIQGAVNAMQPEFKKETNNISVKLCKRQESKSNNKLFRNVDHETNVLAFPTLNDDFSLSNYLGDILICVPVVIEEAEKFCITAKSRMAHMVIHGCLHLIGYDHQTDDQAGTMELKEINILERMEFSNPYLID